MIFYVCFISNIVASKHFRIISWKLFFIKIHAVNVIIYQQFKLNKFLTTLCTSWMNQRVQKIKVLNFIKNRWTNLKPALLNNILENISWTPCYMYWISGWSVDFMWFDFLIKNLHFNKQHFNEIFPLSVTRVISANVFISDIYFGTRIYFKLFATTVLIKFPLLRSLQPIIYL